jgi:hypothetical protein
VAWDEVQVQELKFFPVSDLHDSPIQFKFKFKKTEAIDIHIYARSSYAHFLSGWTDKKISQHTAPP